MLGMKVVYPTVEELAESQAITSGADEGKTSLNPITGEVTADSAQTLDTTMEQENSQVGNQQWTIQKIWQHRVHKTMTNKTKTQHNMYCTLPYTNKDKKCK